jgi:hypothetical protein
MVFSEAECFFSTASGILSATEHVPLVFVFCIRRRFPSCPNLVQIWRPDPNVADRRWERLLEECVHNCGY